MDTTKTTVEKKGNGRVFDWVKVKQHTYVSYYFTPNESIRKYEEKLDELEDFLREVTGDAIVAGNFNAKAIEWGSPHPDRRRSLLLDMSSRLGLDVLNIGTTPTFRRPGQTGTIPDVTFVSSHLVPMIGG